jgi:nitrous oxidase accessory protein
MRRHLLWVNALLLCLLWTTLCSLHPKALWAQATAGVPAFDLAAAIGDAESGSTILVPPGIHAGPLHIDRPLILEGQEGAVIDGGGIGDVITVNAAHVTIRGLTIRNSGDSLDREHAGISGLAPNLTVENSRLENVLFGVYLKNAPNSIVRNNVVLSQDLDIARRGDGIRAWYSDHPIIEDNHVIGSRDVVIWFSSHGIVRRNTVEEGRYGLHFMFSDDQTITENILADNSVGIYIMYGHDLAMHNNLLLDNRGPSGYGIGLKDADNVLAEDNYIVSNRAGIYVDGSPREPNATVTFRRNVLAYNEIGVTMLPLVKRNLFTENIFQENSEQVAVSGNGDLIANDWAAEGRGNYWSDYTGFDANGDEIGDLPYRSQSLYEDLLQKYPELRLFQLSPASSALDLAARAFPIFQPRPKLADPNPLMSPPTVAPVASLDDPATGSHLWVASALVLIALAILFAGVHSRRIAL